ncbi:MAG: hypothetical protein IJQ55_04890 [Alphaproteobacteria bacterium]|nr:hypothetical protein [Alphaproteobacteria bacterium]
MVIKGKNMDDYKIEYKTVVINNKNMASFYCLPGMRGKCSSANHVITIYKYEISPDLVLSKQDIDKLRAKISRWNRKEPEILAHEKQHAKNAVAASPWKTPKNIYEFIGLYCMDEASARSAENLIVKPKNKIDILNAAIKGTEDFLKRKDFYLNHFENALYSNIVCFNPCKPAHPIVRNNSLNMFKESYSTEFYDALSAYFTFYGYELLKDTSIKQTPEWSKFCANVKQIKSACMSHAKAIADQIKVMQQ